MRYTTTYMYVEPVKMQGLQGGMASQRLIRISELPSVKIFKSESLKCSWCSYLKVGITPFNWCLNLTLTVKIKKRGKKRNLKKTQFEEDH